MSKGLWKEPTDEQRHTVATLLAADRKMWGICVEADLTQVGYRKLVNEPGFPALLAEKRRVIEQLKRGNV